jgi:hypothetical protein
MERFAQVLNPLAANAAVRTASVALAISLRATASGFVKAPGSTNFLRSGGRDRRCREFKIYPGR